MTRVLAFGTFDGIHPGHEEYLRFARSLGTELIVIVARDATVRAVKGHLPRSPEAERVRAISALPTVSRAILGRTGEKHAIVRELDPDVICLGYDQHAFTDGLSGPGSGMRARIVRAPPFHPESFKSSLRRELQ